MGLEACALCQCEVLVSVSLWMKPAGSARVHPAFDHNIHQMARPVIGGDSHIVQR